MHFWSNHSEAIKQTFPKTDLISAESFVDQNKKTNDEQNR
jgi:hypothetical protein